MTPNSQRLEQQRFNSCSYSMFFADRGGYGQCEHSESEVNGRVAIEHVAGCWAIEKRDLGRVSHSSLTAQLRDDT